MCKSVLSSSTKVKNNTCGLFLKDVRQLELFLLKYAH